MPSSAPNTDPDRSPGRGPDRSAPGATGPRPASAPPKIPGYEIGEVLGRGATGVVYRARQRIVDREVAIKVLHPELTGNVRLVRRLQREAKTTARLAHPNVVSAIDMGRSGGTSWYAMEFVDGPSLAARLREVGRLREREALRLFIPLCDALEHLREQGVVHRDIKPANILLGRSGARLADLGLAFFGDDPAFTASGGTLGTPHYISPEQAVDASGADTRSDLWSLGATLFHAVCGKPPFSGTSAAEILSAVLYGRVPDPRSLEPSISRGLALVLRKCLTRDPTARYQTPRELAEDLERVRERRSPHVRRSRLDPVVGGRRVRRLAITLAVVLEVALLGGWAFFSRGTGAGQEGVSSSGVQGGASELVTHPAFDALDALEARIARRPRDLAQHLRDLDGLRAGLPPALLGRWEDARSELLSDLGVAVRSEERRALSEFEVALAGNDLIRAGLVLDETLPSRILEVTGLSPEELAKAGVSADDWLRKQRTRLGARTEEVTRELRGALQGWSEARAAEATRLAELQRWDEAFATLDLDGAAILSEAGFGELRIPAPALARVVDDGAGVVLLEKRLELRGMWQELDTELSRRVRTRSETLEKELLRGPPRLRAAQALDQWFALELEARGMTSASLPGEGSRVAVGCLDVLARRRAALLAREEELLEADARTELDRTMLLARPLWKHRRYADVAELWREARSTLLPLRERVRQPWWSDLFELEGRRVEEATLVRSLLLRAADQVRALSGKEIAELRVDDIWYTNRRILVEADPLERGFHIDGREREVDLRELDPDQLLALAGVSGFEGLAPEERLAVGAFFFHEGELEEAREALHPDLSQGGSLVRIEADLERRVFDALEAAELLRKQRAGEAREYLDLVLDEENQARSPSNVVHRIDLLLDGYPEVAAVQLRRSELRALRDRLRNAPAPTVLERIRSVFGPTELEEVGMRRVRLTFDFGNEAVGAWDHGDWAFDGAGWLLDRETPDWGALRAERGPSLTLSEPLDPDRFTLELRFETGAGPAQLLLVHIDGFHAALVGPGMPGDDRGARLLVGTGGRETFFDRLQSGQGRKLEGGMRPETSHRLSFQGNRRSGNWSVELDGKLLGEGRERAPREAAAGILLESWEPIRVREVVLEAGRDSR